MKKKFILAVALLAGLAGLLFCQRGATAKLRHRNELLRAEEEAGRAATAATQAGVWTMEEPSAVAEDAQETRALLTCVDHLKQIGLAARIWANDHQERLPFNFLAMSNELSTPEMLVCPSDTARKLPNDWPELNATNVTYELLSPGAATTDTTDPQIVYVRCPIHNNVGLVNGTVQGLKDTNFRVEKVNGKFIIVRRNTVSSPPQP